MKTKEEILKDEFRTEVHNHYVNITEEQIEGYLDDEDGFCAELPMEYNIEWFATYLQTMFD